jgi:hypothetical protein
MISLIDSTLEQPLLFCACATCPIIFADDILLWTRTFGAWPTLLLLGDHMPHNFHTSPYYIFALGH